jgi:hypothetical protein
LIRGKFYATLLQTDASLRRSGLQSSHTHFDAKWQV